MTKICVRCGEPKGILQFSWKIKGVRRHSHCRSCQSKVSKGWYKKHKRRHIKNVRKNSHKYDEQSHLFICDYLNTHPCVDCGETDIVVLEFDHQDNKIAAVSKMLGAYASLKAIKTEVAKCEVRCANCHRRRTAKQFGSYRLKYSVPVA